MRHTHIIMEMSYRGKPDSVDVKCWCNKSVTFATWWAEAPRGWSKKQWPLFLEAAESFLKMCKTGIANTHR